MNVNSNIRKRNKQTISDRYKKVDTTVNGDAERLVEEHREIEKGYILCALTTVLLSM